MADATVESDPAQPGGHALIRIQGAAAAGLADPRFRISREDYEDGTLGPRGWQVADALLQPLAARADGADLVLSVGPAVVDRIEAGVVTLAVPAAGFDEPVFWPEMPLSRGGQGSAGVAIATAVEARPKPLEGRQKVDPATKSPPVANDDTVIITPPATSRPVDPPVIKPVTETINPPPKPRTALWAALAVLVLLIAGGGAWWATHRPAPVPPPPAPIPAPVPAPVPPPARAHDCSQGSVADIVGCAQSPDDLYKVGQQRWDAGQADQGLVLMQTAADRGSGAAALRLAQLYDPVTFHPGGPIPHPNAREAAKYYRQASQAHLDAATAPREALRQRLQSDSDNGDTLAGLTLKDFWQ